MKTEVLNKETEKHKQREKRGEKETDFNARLFLKRKLVFLFGILL
jgi:hypothetical protein